jgi:hypothetical protein
LLCICSFILIILLRFLKKIMDNSQPSFISYAKNDITAFQLFSRMMGANNNFL